MNNTGPSALEIVLWVLLANVVLIASAYGAIQWLRRKATSGLLQVEEHLQHYDDRVRGILQFLDKYQNVQAEPYLTPLNQLSDDIRDLAVRLQALDETGQVLRAEIEAPAGNQLQNIINAPFNWLSRWRRSRAMLKESAALDARLAAIEQSTHTIDALPWKTALEIRQATVEVAEMARMAQSLQQNGARGSSLQSATARIPIMQRALAGVPPKFINAGQNELLASATPTETIAAYSALTSARPIIDHWLPYLKEWDQSQHKAAVELQGIRQAIAALQNAVAHPPSGLRAEPMQERLRLVTGMAAELEKRLAYPDVDQLKNLMREATRIRRLAEDAGQQINKAGERAAILQNTLAELTTAIEALSTRIKSQEGQDRHPLVLDESSAEVNRLRQALQALGPAGQERTPEQISAGLEKAAVIRARHKELQEKVQRAIEQHQALVDLLESADLKEGAAWVLSARELIAQAEAYDPRHWSKPESIETLKADLAGLAALQERVVPAGQAVPIKESRLKERLQEAQQLAVLHKTLRPRAAAVRSRLDKILALEKEGKEKLTAAWNALERASILTNDNELLRQVAEAEIKRQSDELKRLGEELNARGQGLIEKKVQSIQAQYHAVLQAIQSWMARLDAENQAIARQIGDWLAELDNIAALEDPPFQEARKLIASPDLRPRTGVTGPLRNPLAAKTPPSEQELSAEIKRKNDLWLDLNGAAQALEEKSAAILEAYREALEARAQAQRVLGDVAARLAQRRAWPPANQPPLPENQSLAPIDAKWDAMRKQHVRSDWAILELGRLANLYRALSERASALLERILQDQERILEIEEQIEDLKQRWLQQAQAAPDNLILSNGVQQLVSRVDAQLAYIRQQYMRGALSYAEVQQSLHLLSDEILTARVPVDENHDMGLPNQRSRSPQSPR